LFNVKLPGSSRIYTRRYATIKIIQTEAPVKKRFNLTFPSPLIVLMNVLECNGFIRNANAASPAMNGNNIKVSSRFSLMPGREKSFGFSASCDITWGSENDFTVLVISIGKVPIRLLARNTSTSMTIYLQRLFLPANDDSRCFI
jgi:hypothetical protein